MKKKSMILANAKLYPTYIDQSYRQGNILDIALTTNKSI